MRASSSGIPRASRSAGPIVPRVVAVVAASTLACIGLAPATAQDVTWPKPTPERIAESSTAQLSTTQHAVTIDGGLLEYSAHAGRLPIRVNETGEVRGYVFFTYYQLDGGTPSEPRPLTFLWNGGPGANSVLVHLLGFGPERIRTPDTPLDPPDCDCALEPNDGTWLEFTDLVFVDPIGTGFSRPAQPEYTDEFYGAREDAAYIAEFIRLFVTRFDTWDAPLFIGGESYGTWRAAGAAKRLEETGMPVAGVLLISGGVPVGGVEEEEMRVAHLITSRTAAAFYHHRLDADLQGDLETARGPHRAGRVVPARGAGVRHRPGVPRAGGEIPAGDRLGTVRPRGPVALQSCAS